jgi:hypothetical protein
VDAAASLQLTAPSRVQHCNTHSINTVSAASTSHASPLQHLTLAPPAVLLCCCSTPHTETFCTDFVYIAALPFAPYIMCCHKLLYTGLAAKLTAHKEKEREQVEALLASQKHLTSNVRTLINSKHKAAAGSGLHVRKIGLACKTLRNPNSSAWSYLQQQQSSCVARQGDRLHS